MKRFLPKFLILFGLMIATIGIYRYVVYPKITKDLSALGKIPVGQAYVDSILNAYPYDSTWIIQWHAGMPIDTGKVLVIGDSFSNKEVEKKENSWSRYMAEALGIKIINFCNYDCSICPEHLFLCLLEEGVIPSGSIVIVESVERVVPLRLLMERIPGYYQCYIDGLEASYTKRIETPSINWLAETAMYIRFRMGWKCPVHKYHLTQNCFNHPRYANVLFTYWEDEANIDQQIDEQIPAIRKELDHLYEKAREYDVTLIYMIAADKYDAYEPLIREKHTINPLLDYFPMSDSLINTKEILQPYIKEGVQDVYRLDDTHWSPIGAKIVGEEVTKRIKSLQN